MIPKDLRLDLIPQALRDTPRWVLWKNLSVDGSMSRKMPMQCDGQPAKADDADTWNTFSEVADRYSQGGFNGLGFEFGLETRRGEFSGIDLDGCRDKNTGSVAQWARDIIIELDTYAEVSPSKTGVKLFLFGKSPLPSGKKKELEAPAIGSKKPAIEVYDWGRYFAVTGWRLKGPHEPQQRQERLTRLVNRYWPVVSPVQVDFRSADAVTERARKYVATMPAAISGSDGHGATFRVACVLVLGFGLPKDDAYAILCEYNTRCQPPWSERDLRHKIESADRQSGERNYLRNTSPERWSTVPLRIYREPVEQPKQEIRTTTLLNAAQSYLDSLRSGKNPLIETELPELDYALAGGVEAGEMVILAARPSHGKSAAALQCVHAWTGRGIPTLMISEEMSSLALGKRTLQFVSDVPEEHWKTSSKEVEGELAGHFEQRADCHIVESCGSVQAAIEQIEKHIEEHGVRAVVVDYAQLLRSSGRTRYEQITNTSIALRCITSKHRLLTLVLCQLNRGIEDRKDFVPIMSDIKETGQLEQDADVIVFLVWPHRIDSKVDPHKFQLFIAKNRNRAINSAAVVCRFEPSRQRLRDNPVEEHPRFNKELARHGRE